MTQEIATPVAVPVPWSPLGDEENRDSLNPSSQESSTGVAMQLTLDGRSVPHSQVVRHRRPLTDVQQDILRRAVLNRKGWIRSVEAGNIVHAHRPRHGTSPNYQAGKSLGCCKYAASDGSEACKRLAARGLLSRIERGVWEVTGGISWGG